MSKTSVSVLCETNLVSNLPQENAFVFKVFRQPQDYKKIFNRMASSDAPIQICAIASAQGEDRQGAMILQKIFHLLEQNIIEIKKQKSFDFTSFSQKFIYEANSMVCKLASEKMDKPIMVSLTIAILETKKLRLLHVGNTRALLVRKKEIKLLTNDQTIAGRYQDNTLASLDYVNRHPEKNHLTQYLGRFAQDGPIVPQQTAQIDLEVGDEIILLGTGIAQGLTSTQLSEILLSSSSIEKKNSDLLEKTLALEVKGGLSSLVWKVDQIFAPVIPSFGPANGAEIDSFNALAVGAMAANESTLNALEAERDLKFDLGDKPFPSERQNDPNSFAPENTGKVENSEDNSIRAVGSIDTKPISKYFAWTQTKAWKIGKPFVFFLGFMCVGYFAMMLVFNIGTPDKNNPSVSEILPSGMVDLTLRKVNYITANLTPLYQAEDKASIKLMYLSKGDVVTVLSVKADFTQVETEDKKMGYVLNTRLSDEDPTIFESLPEVTHEFIPSYPSTKVTTSVSKETTRSTYKEPNYTTKSTTASATSKSTETSSTEETTTGAIGSEIIVTFPGQTPTPTPTVSETTLPTTTEGPTNPPDPTPTPTPTTEPPLGGGE